jgi:hypothetical protein
MCCAHACKNKNIVVKNYIFLMLCEKKILLSQKQIMVILKKNIETVYWKFKIIVNNKHIYEMMILIKLKKKIWKSPWFPQNLVRTTPGSFFPFIFLSEILVPYKKVSMIKKEKWKIWKKHVKKKQILEHDDIVITTNKNWAVNKQQHATAFLKTNKQII